MLAGTSNKLGHLAQWRADWLASSAVPVPVPGSSEAMSRRIYPGETKSKGRSARMRLTSEITREKSRHLLSLDRSEFAPVRAWNVPYGKGK